MSHRRFLGCKTSMLIEKIVKNKTWLSFLGCAVFTAVLLFPNLGRFGMWEPQEVDMMAAASGEGETGEPFRVIEQHLAALGWQMLGRTELGSRLPIALVGFATALLLFGIVLSLSEYKLALISTAFYVASPFFIFHAKQLTGGMPPYLAELAAMGGLALMLRHPKSWLRVSGAALALFGVWLGCTARGVLVGGAYPVLTVSAAFLVSRKEDEGGRQGLLPYSLVVIGLLAVGAFFAAVFFAESDIPWITGGIASKVNKPGTFDFALEQIVYGWYPWIAFMLMAVVPLFEVKSRDTSRTFLRALALLGLVLGYITQVFSLDINGMLPASVGLPVALGIALSIDDLTRVTRPDRLLVFITAAMLTLMIRDFAQNNQTLLYGYGFEKIDIPDKQFTHIIQAGLFTIPFALLILTAFWTKSRWQARAFGFFASLSPIVFGAFLSFGLVPGLSVQLSSKHAVEVYKKFRTDNEPLAVYGKARLSSEAKTLKTIQDVVEWLTKDERVFVVFPPDKLASLDHRLRKKTGNHIHVLDAKSDRFYVATSKPKKGEKNQNPIAPFVQSKPYAKGPSHETSVNFDDTVTLLGWDLESDGKADQLHKGKTMKFTSYWRVEKRFTSKYKIFMHIDGPGGRIHGDHEPFDGKLPTTRWQKGDYIKETYEKKIPLYQGSGKYTVRMGLYKSSGRLPVKNDPTAKENSVLITSIMLK